MAVHIAFFHEKQIYSRVSGYLEALWRLLCNDKIPQRLIFKMTYSLQQQRLFLFWTISCVSISKNYSIMILALMKRFSAINKAQMRHTIILNSKESWHKWVCKYTFVSYLFIIAWDNQDRCTILVTKWYLELYYESGKSFVLLTRCVVMCGLADH